MSAMRGGEVWVISGGPRTLAAVARLAVRTPGPMIIVGASDTVRFLLEVTSLSDRMEFWPDDVPAPLRALRAQQE